MDKLQFVPGAFVDNLKYMAVGMVGVFMIIGIIIASTAILKKVTTKKK